MVTVKYPVDSYHNPIFGVVAIPSGKFCSSFFWSVYLLLNCQNVFFSVPKRIYAL